MGPAIEPVAVGLDPLPPHPLAPLPVCGERGVPQTRDGVWGLVRGFHPAPAGLLNLLPSGERTAARPEASRSGQHGLSAWSPIPIAT